jgi:hypothetical protein
VPFIRYSRDKRGYETTVVQHAYRSAQGSQRSRVLYMFRTPSNLRVGRRSLDEEVMEALEHTHPDLAFDWTTLQREIVGERSEYRDRDREREHVRRPPPRRPDVRPPVVPAPPPVIEDQSPLGRAVGASTAARLRGRFSDLLQRIARRAKSPEDRDRLTERAVRLNPDEWPDEATMRASAQTVEAEWEAIASELPQRRRGRRGGRHRRDTPPGSIPPVSSARPAADGPADAPSAIMTGQGETHASENSGDVAGEDRGADAGRDRGAVGSDTVEADAAPDPAADFHEDR